MAIRGRTYDPRTIIDYPETFEILGYTNQGGAETSLIGPRPPEYEWRARARGGQELVRTEQPSGTNPFQQMLGNMYGGAGGYEQYPQFGAAEEPTKGRADISSALWGASRDPTTGLPTTQPARPIGQITTARTILPAGEMPKLDLKDIDVGRVRALTQKAMAPRLRLYRAALSRALTRSYENPNVRRMMVREALQGYGQMVEQARAGAEQYATREEAAERAITNQELVAAYSAAMEKYRLGAQQVSTTQQIYEGQGAQMTPEGVSIVSGTRRAPPGWKTGGTVF